jgi:hypothetical protein
MTHKHQNPFHVHPCHAVPRPQLKLWKLKKGVVDSWKVTQTLNLIIRSCSQSVELWLTRHCRQQQIPFLAWIWDWKMDQIALSMWIVEEFSLGIVPSFVLECKW